MKMTLHQFLYCTHYYTLYYIIILSSLSICSIILDVVKIYRSFSPEFISYDSFKRRYKLKGTL